MSKKPMKELVKAALALAESWGEGVEEYLMRRKPLYIIRTKRITPARMSKLGRSEETSCSGVSKGDLKTSFNLKPKSAVMVIEIK